MAEERRQNIFIVLASSGLTASKHTYGQLISYPLSEEMHIETQEGNIPNDIKVDLGNTALSLEDSEKCINELSTALKASGCKLTSDMDLQYCSMSIDGGTYKTLVECILSFVVKG